MSKKILIISSSPRKGGNSDLLCDEFIRGASEAGHKTEKVFLRDKNIHYCIGCGVCNSTAKCVQSDDMEQILESMVEADVIVLATPVYFYTMDAQLKTLIDRTVPRYTEMRNKELYYIMTAADEEIEHMQKTVESLRGFTMDCLDGAVEKGIIYGVGAWNKGEILDTPAMAQAYQMGKNS
ncbi:MAG: flavodoxin family protein [Hungatella hathewayi]|nr:flavodoxin family protein [Hungatella hathewayi]